jgi:copper chaperone CopZ
MKNKITIFGGLAILLTGWLVLAYDFGSHAIESSSLKTLTLRIEGMTWGAWPVAVKRALEGLKGVKRADVSFSKEEAVVYFDEGQTAVKEMIQAVRKIGFRAVVKSAPWKSETGPNHGRKQVV